MTPGGDLPAISRVARATVGAVLLASACVLRSRVLAALAAWFGIAHVLAAVAKYPGCPELGAVPSLLLGREVYVACGPWSAVDKALAGERPQ